MNRSKFWRCIASLKTVLWSMFAVHKSVVSRIRAEQITFSPWRIMSAVSGKFTVCCSFLDSLVCQCLLLKLEFWVELFRNVWCWIMCRLTINCNLLRKNYRTRDSSALWDNVKVTTALLAELRVVYSISSSFSPVLVRAHAHPEIYLKDKEPKGAHGSYCLAMPNWKGKDDIRAKMPWKWKFKSHWNLDVEVDTDLRPEICDRVFRSPQAHRQVLTPMEARTHLRINSPVSHLWIWWGLGDRIFLRGEGGDGPLVSHNSCDVGCAYAARCRRTTGLVVSFVVRSVQLRSFGQKKICKQQRWICLPGTPPVVGDSVNCISNFGSSRSASAESTKSRNSAPPWCWLVRRHTCKHNKTTCHSDTACRRCRPLLQRSTKIRDSHNVLSLFRVDSGSHAHSSDSEK